MSALHKNWRTTSERIEKFISSDSFTSTNLYGRLYTKVEPIQTLKHLDYVSFQPETLSAETDIIVNERDLKIEDVVQRTDWSDVSSDFKFGPTWSIHWFCVVLPDGVANKENCFLRWNSGTEALVYSNDKEIVQGVNSTHKRELVPLWFYPSCNTYYFQVTCSQLFGAGVNGIIEPPPTPAEIQNNLSKFSERYQLREVAFVERDPLVYELLIDLQILIGIAKEYKETCRGYQALYTANKMVNLCLEHVREGYDESRRFAMKFFSETNGKSSSQMTLHAIGHCHIDSAWLWRYAETVRKCSRSWSSTVALMKQYPQLHFVVSQAQQLKWVKDVYPSLFRDIQQLAKQNRFIPVGGTWVEMDANLPCCESLIRQFYYGQKFFQSEFGITCKQFWLPDTFGYTPQLPQIMTLCGVDSFVTQKISWSLINKFPHHTFYWQGIDGTRVLTHFPPGDSYTMTANVGELKKSVENFQDKGRSAEGMFLFGHGDGGQGPTETMIQTLTKVQDCSELPRVKFSTPEAFFLQLREHAADQLLTWHGELYLELHNGTYTTHHHLKRLNLTCEHALIHAEQILVTCLLRSVQSHDYVKPNDDTLQWFREKRQQLDDNWRDVLLNQFHDVLPGSSIEAANDDAFFLYKKVLKRVQQTEKEMRTFLCTDASSTDAEVVSYGCYNSTAWPLLIGTDTEQFCMKPFSFDILNWPILQHPDQCYDQLGNLCMRNQYLNITVDRNSGWVNSLVHLKSGRESVSRCRPLTLMLFDDVPLFWDAWDIMDYHMETGCNVLECGFSVTEKPHFIYELDAVPKLRRRKVKTSLTHEASGSVIVLTYSLEADVPYLIVEVQVKVWLMEHKLLKMCIPSNLTRGTSTTSEAYFEVPGGFIQRPTHTNTSWDWAKHEVCSHRWLALQEYNFGIAILKEACYGGVVRENVIYLSLLRSTKAPDATADCKRGSHEFTFGIYPYSGCFQLAEVVRYSHQMTWKVLLLDENLGEITERRVTGVSQLPWEPLFLVLSENIVVLTTYMPESCDIVFLRVNEIHGGSGSVSIQVNFRFAKATKCDCLETDINDSCGYDDREWSIKTVENVELSSVVFHITPFEICTLKFSLF